jgi:hypothetical protein
MAQEYSEKALRKLMQQRQECLVELGKTSAITEQLLDFTLKIQAVIEVVEKIKPAAERLQGQ